MSETSTTSRHVVIAGGSGFLGRNLTDFLLHRGDRVTILSRSREPTAAVRGRDVAAVGREDAGGLERGARRR